MGKNMSFSVHLPNLLREAIEGNPSGQMLVIPMRITQGLLAKVAARAIELDDPEMNALMLELALYEVDPRERPTLIARQRARGNALTPGQRNDVDATIADVIARCAKPEEKSNA